MENFRDKITNKVCLSCAMIESLQHRDKLTLNLLLPKLEEDLEKLKDLCSGNNKMELIPLVEELKKLGLFADNFLEGKEEDKKVGEKIFYFKKIINQLIELS